MWRFKTFFEDKNLSLYYSLRSGSGQEELSPNFITLNIICGSQRIHQTGNVCSDIVSVNVWYLFCLQDLFWLFRLFQFLINNKIHRPCWNRAIFLKEPSQCFLLFLEVYIHYRDQFHLRIQFRKIYSMLISLSRMFCHPKHLLCL